MLGLVRNFKQRMIGQAGSSSKPPKVAIIGAGLTGLLAAQGLRKSGFNVVVFEREKSFDARSRDWTILLHWAMPALTNLLPEDIKKNIPKAICNPYLDFNEEVECLPCYHGITGELLFKSPLPDSRRVSRQRLRRVLANGLDIKWGTTLSQISFPSDRSDDDAATENKVHLVFDDGEQDTTDYVFAADGASSKVRELILGPDAARVQFSGFMFATGIANYHDADKVQAVVKAHPVAAITLGMEAVTGCGVMYVGDKNDMSTWTTFWTKIWKGSADILPKEQDALEFIKETTKNVCEPFQSLINWTPLGSSCYVDEMKYWVPVPFNNHAGRVTLAGDAAHPMLIYRGQGFQHAIVDVTNYIEALTKIRDVTGIADRKAIMSAFDAEMIERTAKAVKQSLQEAEYSMNEETVSKMLIATQGHGRSA